MPSWNIYFSTTSQSVRTGTPTPRRHRSAGRSTRRSSPAGTGQADGSPSTPAFLTPLLGRQRVQGLRRRHVRLRPRGLGRLPELIDGLAELQVRSSIPAPSHRLQLPELRRRTPLAVLQNSHHPAALWPARSISSGVRNAPKGGTVPCTRQYRSRPRAGQGCHVGGGTQGRPAHAGAAGTCSGGHPHG